MSVPLSILRPLLPSASVASAAAANSAIESDARASLSIQTPSSTSNLTLAPLNFNQLPEAQLPSGLIANNAPNDDSLLAIATALYPLPSPLPDDYVDNVKDIADGIKVTIDDDQKADLIEQLQQHGYTGTPSDDDLKRFVQLHLANNLMRMAGGKREHLRALEKKPLKVTIQDGLGRNKVLDKDVDGRVFHRTFLMKANALFKETSPSADHPNGDTHDVLTHELAHALFYADRKGLSRIMLKGMSKTQCSVLMTDFKAVLNHPDMAQQLFGDKHTYAQKNLQEYWAELFVLFQNNPEHMKATLPDTYQVMCDLWR